MGFPLKQGSYFLEILNNIGKGGSAEKTKKMIRTALTVFWKLEKSRIYVKFLRFPVLFWMTASRCSLTANGRSLTSLLWI